LESHSNDRRLTLSTSVNTPEEETNRDEPTSLLN
jgi:hypothetical protein